jgi:PKD repeat protein
MANFNSSISDICMQGSVNFSDLSIGGAICWDWTFEGGSPQTSIEQNPVVFYNDTGSFDVKLTVYDGIGSSTVATNDYIKVSSMPQIPETIWGPVDVNTNITVTTNYFTLETNYAESYIWEILPVEAGTISGDGLMGTLNWTLNREGTASIKVRGYNETCGFGQFSESYNVVCYLSGINDQVDAAGINIYPNPTKNTITVSDDLGLQREITLSIFNLTNAQVAKEKFQNQKLIEFDVCTLPKGIYLVKIQTGQEMEVQKLVIQ